MEKMINCKIRKLTYDEINFLHNFLHNTNLQNIDLSDIDVEEMNDGNMGSLYFINSILKSFRNRGKCLKQQLYFDIDMTEVLVSIDIDLEGNLYELDIWKVNFEPLTNGFFSKALSKPI